jgi:nitroreductase
MPLITARGDFPMAHFAGPDYPINDLIAKRWSPFGFDDRRVSEEDLRALFEAARWSASANNEQPWSYIVATRDQAEEYQRLLSCVEKVNQPWARFASVLMLGCARLTLEHTGLAYQTAEHDLGLATGNLVFEATARGLVVHQMIHIHRDRARRLYQIPEGVKPVAGLAIGYAGNPSRLGLHYQHEDLVRRPRKPLDSFIFSGSWLEVSPLIKQ